MAEAVAARGRKAPRPQPVLRGRHDFPEISGRISSVVRGGILRASRPVVGCRPIVAQRRPVVVRRRVTVAGR